MTLERYDIDVNTLNYENLANAIVLQAVVDYELAIAILSTEYHADTGRAKRKVLDRKVYAEKLKNDCERFFKSGYFDALTKVDESAIRKHIIDGIRNAKMVVYNEEKDCYFCKCGQVLPVRQNKKLFGKPVIKCVTCKNYWRVFGDPVELEK